MEFEIGFYIENWEKLSDFAKDKLNIKEEDYIELNNRTVLKAIDIPSLGLGHQMSIYAEHNGKYNSLSREVILNINNIKKLINITKKYKGIFLTKKSHKRIISNLKILKKYMKLCPKLNIFYFNNFNYGKILWYN